MLLPIYILKYYSKIKLPKYLPLLKIMQSNENNEFLSARCLAGWVRLAQKPPIVSIQ
jgi:hypothetical protein